MYKAKRIEPASAEYRSILERERRLKGNADYLNRQQLESRPLFSDPAAAVSSCGEKLNNLGGVLEFMSRSMRLRAYKRFLRFRKLLSDALPAMREKEPMVGGRFINCAPERRSPLKNGLSDIVLVTSKPLRKYSASHKCFVTFVEFTAHSYDGGHIEKFRLVKPVPAAFISEPYLYPEILKNLEPLYAKSSGRMYYIGKFPGRWEDKKVVFPTILPQTKRALLQCLNESRIDLEEYNQCKDFVLCGSGAHGIRDPLSISDRDFSFKLSRWRPRLYFLRLIKSNELPLFPFDLREWRSYIADVSIKLNTGAGPRESAFLGAKTKRDFLELSTLHAYKVLDGFCDGKTVISDSIWKQGRRPKRFKTSFTGKKELTGRSVCMTDTWENIVTSVILAPLKAYTDACDGSIYSSYSRAHLGFKRQDVDNNASSHQVTGDFAKGEFHYDLYSKLTAASLMFARYAVNKASICAAIYFLSSIAFVKLIFPGGFILSVENMLPSGMACMGLIWGILNTYMYSLFAWKVFSRVRTRIPELILPEFFKVNVLGDDGFINFYCGDLSDPRVEGLGPELFTEVEMNTFFVRLFGFEVDGVVWSDFSSSSLESKADFLKEVVRNGRSFWKRSALLNIFSSTQKSYFKLLKYKSKCRSKGIDPTAGIINGSYYDAFAHFEAIVGAGVEPHPELDFVNTFGAHLMHARQDYKGSFADCLSYVETLRTWGLSTVLNSPGLSGYRSFNALYKHKENSLSRVNIRRVVEDFVLGRMEYHKISFFHMNSLSCPLGAMSRKYCSAFGLTRHSKSVCPQLRSTRLLAVDGFTATSSDKAFLSSFAEGAFDVHEFDLGSD